MKTNTKSIAQIVFCSTVLVFIFLFLTMLLSSWIIAVCVNAGFITLRPGTPYFPFLIHAGVVSIIIGLFLSVFLCFFPILPLSQFIHAIHAVAEGNFGVKVSLCHPRIFRTLAESFNQMTEELSRIEILRSDFINNFSHEFKTPIMSIMGFAQLLQNSEISCEEKNEYLRIIISECRRLSDLSSNILNLSKMESMSVLTSKTEYDVDEQIRQAILQLQEKWEKKEICFDLTLQSGRIVGNSDLLKEVWVNLIDNAVKFSPVSGCISIHTECSANSFLFRITDHGIGMDSRTQKNIFDRFYQGDVSHASEGNGLGLSLVRKITELHGGSVSAESSPGKGSIFTVILPLR